MKNFISLLALGFIFSASLACEARAVPASGEYLCEGEDNERFVRLKIFLDDDLKILQLDMLQETQHDDGPFPLLPLQYSLNDLSGHFTPKHIIYSFAPSNYQSCIYNLLWPLNPDSSSEFTSSIHLNCEGLPSQIRLHCTGSDFE